MEFARAEGIAVEVVSDGLGFFVADGLADVGSGDLRVYSAEMAFGSGRPIIHFPDGHPICQVCGTCKRDPILRHQAMGRHVVFVGDGHSDQYAAAYADTLFAKNELAELCDRRSIGYRPWTTFLDIRNLVASSRLARRSRAARKQGVHLRPGGRNMRVLPHHRRSRSRK